jgi:hypothetical protein
MYRTNEGEFCVIDGEYGFCIAVFYVKKFHC